MDQKVKNVLIKRLDQCISKLAYNDYIKANTSKQGEMFKRYKPYTLSSETVEAKQLLDLLYFNDVISKDQEEKIKGYLLLNRQLWQV